MERTTNTRPDPGIMGYTEIISFPAALLDALASDAPEQIEALAKRLMQALEPKRLQPAPVWARQVHWGHTA